MNWEKRTRAEIKGHPTLTVPLLFIKDWQVTNLQCAKTDIHKLESSFWWRYKVDSKVNFEQHHFNAPSHHHTLGAKVGFLLIMSFIQLRNTNKEALACTNKKKRGLSKLVPALIKMKAEKKLNIPWILVWSSPCDKHVDVICTSRI